ncbi:uncharacterized protein [Lolium perenne]|uniref:uncharacterized protein n=1 Tax=Lolium perenne TaxID=4522 RepID=UPI003A98D4C6
MEEERCAAAAFDEIRRLPAEVNWEMLGAALFSGVSAALYPAVVVKTHLQVAPPPQAAAATVTVPARAFYMAALEATKSSVGPAAVRLGVSEPAASAIASAAAGVSAAVAAQVVWTTVDVVSQRLVVHSARRPLDLLNNPDLVAADAVVSFRAALWFWMALQADKPSSHAWSRSTTSAGEDQIEDKRRRGPDRGQAPAWT